MGSPEASEPRHSRELGQLSLFSSTPEEFTASMQVSVDEMNSWFHNDLPPASVQHRSRN